ncbi:PREDICTED: transcription termination factor 3, mitochondrial [Polistes dominula]|uniref:Transcription termination factor 3, mitochondrial n=1 Tax=Polistes dominula TaxID=743375 RepID=A0ABM1J9M5_POLDO|nr:PREDICTED: transcription termination factor 3, mitochondrial [Polistes dominula]
MIIKMWSTRCYASLLSNAKQINVIKNIFKKRFSSQGSDIVDSHKKTENVNNSINPNAHSSSIESKLAERGYVEKAWNLENEVIPVQNLQETQSNSSDLIQKIITNSDDLSIYEDYIKLPKALDVCNEDISHIGSYQLPSFNIAKFANSSETIQRLIKLGVKLYKHETDTELMEFLLSKDFEKDLFPYIRFLHDCGVPGEYLGKFFSKNPYLFKVDMDDLHTRIRYLRFHQFDINMIKEIICTNPKWLNYSTKIIDTRLGYFQTTFRLSGKQVRKLTTKNSKLITYKMSHIRENTFVVKELMGFNPYEMKTILLNQPKIWMKCRKNIISTFDYAHNEMKLSHEFISSQPYVLLCRKRRLEQRHKFLVKLGRAQYDPTKPMYVSLIALIGGTDDQFCQNVAKTSRETYDLFLKSM